MTGAPEEESSFTPDGRELCADDACIGLLGADGRCKVCGKPGGDAAAPAGEEVGEVRVVDESEHPEEVDDFTERRLCPDDACIGVLDSDGRCKVCGRSGPSV